MQAASAGRSLNGGKSTESGAQSDLCAADEFLITITVVFIHRNYAQILTFACHDDPPARNREERKAFN